TPTGRVTYWDGPANTGVRLGERALSGGNASLSTAALALGTHAITVVYDGDGNFNADTSVLSYTVANAATTTAVTAWPATSFFGQRVTVTATVKRSIGSGVPTGTVTFVFPGGTPVTVPVNAQGKAVAAFALAQVGMQPVVANFTATGIYADSTGQ